MANVYVTCPEEFLQILNNEVIRCRDSGDSAWVIVQPDQVGNTIPSSPLTYDDVSILVVSAYTVWAVAYVIREISMAIKFG